MLLQLGPYKLDIDVEKTREANKQVISTNFDCPCGACQNFTPAILLSDRNVLSFLDQLGLDPRKPSEIWENLTQNGLVEYGGFYHLIGSINEVSEPEFFQKSKKVMVFNPERLIKISKSFSVSFSDDCSLVPKSYPDPVFQMNIACGLPWVLDYVPEQDMQIKMPKESEITFATLSKKCIVEYLDSTTYKLVFSTNTEIVTLVVDFDTYNSREIGWFGILAYHNNEVVYCHDIKDDEDKPISK